MHKRRRTLGLKPVSKRQRGVIQVAGPDCDVSDPNGSFYQLMVSDLCAELVQLYREVGILHLAFESVAQRLAHSLGGVKVPLIASRKERSEERDALDVVPMRMADKICFIKVAGSVASRCSPSPRMPVPQSMIIRAPPGLVISTHEVLPPYRTVVGPGVASDPRAPPEPNVHGRTSRPMSTCRCLAVRACRPVDLVQQSSMVEVGEAHPPKDIRATWPSR